MTETRPEYKLSPTDKAVGHTLKLWEQQYAQNNGMPPLTIRGGELGHLKMLCITVEVIDDVDPILVANLRNWIKNISRVQLGDPVGFDRTLSAYMLSGPWGLRIIHPVQSPAELLARYHGYLRHGGDKHDITVEDLIKHKKIRPILMEMIELVIGMGIVPHLASGIDRTDPTISNGEHQDVEKASSD